MHSFTKGTVSGPDSVLGLQGELKSLEKEFSQGYSYNIWTVLREEEG